MKFITKILLLLLLSTTVSACNNDDDNQNECNENAIVSSEEYETAPNDPLNINSVTIEGDCLTINFVTGGCDGESWIIKFISSEIIEPTVPPSRQVRLSLIDNEDCEALITKNVSFNIKNLRVEGNNVVLLFDNSSIEYEY